MFRTGGIQSVGEKQGESRLHPPFRFSATQVSIKHYLGSIEEVAKLLQKY